MEYNLNTVITNSDNKNIKSTLKLLLIFLPILGLLTGIGLGLILGATKFETNFDLYIKVGTVLLPAVSILIIALNRYFKQIDSL